jgi:hypothetical protein
MAMEDPTGRAKGTAPLGTPVEEGGMECANEVCLPLPPLNAMASSMGFTLTLCCTPEGECGTISNDNPCRIIPDSSPQCPRLALMDWEIASCCTEDGKCGLNGEALMMKPCGSIEEAMQMFGQFIDFPAPRACTPEAGTPATTVPASGGMPAADAGVGTTP